MNAYNARSLKLQLLIDADMARFAISGPSSISARRNIDMSKQGKRPVIPSSVRHWRVRAYVSTIMEAG
ncbi:hypothetical protein, partial [Robbsia andropogonis]|uniref:hypothetical protein n=1 Tax=Robbsia andropogonis TaxID=28092 RepID=UPI0020A219C5